MCEENYGFYNEFGFDIPEPNTEDLDSVIPEQRRNEAAKQARIEFNDGSLLIANGCTYSLDDMKTGLNNNVLIVGGSGTGKTRYEVCPNLKQAVGSYILVDPKGNLHKQFAEELTEKGYQVHVVDFTQPEKSAHYNPMHNVKSTHDILKIANVLINEKASAGTTADPFWDSAALMLVSALIGYMIETRYIHFNFSGLLSLMREGEREGENEGDSKHSKLSRRFDKLKRLNPDSWACSMFENVNQSADKTYDSIRISLAAKFAKFDTREMRALMNGNDIDFSHIGQEKTALFVIVSDTDRSMDSFVNIFFTQAMQRLCEYADKECKDSRLPVPVRFILDDFATNCRIDEFPRMISSIRSRGISVMLMIQSEAQLTQGYQQDDKTIISNCDTYVYLGGNDLQTAEKVSIRCNKPLHQVLNMPVGSCWVFRRGNSPVYTKLNIPVSREMER